MGVTFAKLCLRHIKGSTTPADFISRTVERVDFCANDLDDDSVSVRPLDAGFNQDLTTEACTQSGYIHPAPYVRHPGRRGHRSIAVEIPTELRQAFAHNQNQHTTLSHKTTGTSE